MQWDAAKLTGFDWDAGNQKKSLDKHAVTCDEAEQVFVNAPLKVLFDPAHSEAEPTHSATINVACSTADLTAAINAANSEITNPGPDTLELAAGCNYAYTTPAVAGYLGTALPVIISDLLLVSSNFTLASSYISLYTSMGNLL